MADVRDYFSNTLPKSLESKPEIVSEIDNTYQFDIEDAGRWVVDLTVEGGKVYEGSIEDPGCVVTAKEKDFGKLLDNPASGMMLFTMGKLKVTNLPLGMALNKLLS